MTRKTEIAFPEVAIIRKGDPKKKIFKDGKEIEIQGPDLNELFRVVFNPGVDAIAEKFLKIYGTDHPKVIRAMIPFPSVWSAWEYYNEAYNFGRLVARADEDKYLWLKDPVTNELVIEDGKPFREYRPGEDIEYDRNGKHFTLPMRSTGRLRLWLPEMERMVYFLVYTTSFYDCQFITQNLGAVQGIADAVNGGNAAGIPLIVYRKKGSYTYTNKKTGIATRGEKWFIAIEVDPAFAAEMIKRMTARALTGGEPAPLLPAPEIHGEADPEDEEPEEEEYLAPQDAQPGEFHPEEQRHPPVVEEIPEPALVADVALSVLQAAPHDSAGRLVRPMTPEVLRASLSVKAESYTTRSVSQKQVGLAAMLLEQLFSNQPEPKKIRHSVTNYLFGFESLSETPAPLVLALLDWLKPTQTQSGEYVVEKTAAIEAQSLFPAACKAAGQMELF